MAKARAATKLIYQLKKNGEFSKCYGLCNQIRRASVSVMANIAEGNGRRTNNDFAHSWCRRTGLRPKYNHIFTSLLILHNLSKEDFNEAYGLFDEVSRMLMALAQHLRNSQ